MADKFHLRFALILVGHLAVGGGEGQVESQPISLAAVISWGMPTSHPSQVRLCCIQKFTRVIWTVLPSLLLALVSFLGSLVMARWWQHLLIFTLV